MLFLSRRSPRIPGYDYSSVNYYFITVCTDQHKCLFGKPGQLNEYGRIAEKYIQKMEDHYENIIIDKYVVMPNHIHLIMIIQPHIASEKADQIVGRLKAGISREIHKIDPGLKVWQRSFHDHIIRNEKGYQKIWEYIENNPLKWEADCFYKK